MIAGGLSLVIRVSLIFSLGLVCFYRLYQLFLNLMCSFKYFVHIVSFHILLTDDLAEIFAVELYQLRENGLEVDE